MPACLLLVVAVLTPNKLETRYDMLDTLRDGAVWSVNGIALDTGRTSKSIQCVASRLERDGLIHYERRAVRSTAHSRITITDKGLRWLWWVDHDLPGQGDDVLSLLLGALEDGPALTSQIGPKVGDPKATPNGRTRAALMALKRQRAVKVTPQYSPDGAHEASRVTLTKHGRELLQKQRAEPYFGGRSE